MRAREGMGRSKPRPSESLTKESPEEVMTTPTTPIPEGNYAQIDGGLRIHYHEDGTGEPVIFLHGSGPGASGYSNFKGNYLVFAERGFRAIVPDLPGFGLSSKPENAAYVLDLFVQALNGLLGKLGIQRCVLLGNSLGGAIAIKFTLDHPEVVSRLILMARMRDLRPNRRAKFDFQGVVKDQIVFTGSMLGVPIMRDHEYHLGD